MTLETRVLDLALQIASDVKELRATRGAMSSLTTTNKASLVAALNELNVSISNSSSINDLTVSALSTWSSSKISSVIDSAVAALVSGAPSALDTLEELANALGDDPNFATTVAVALGNRVRVDAAQSFTSLEQALGRLNIAAAAADDLSTLSLFVGSANTNFANEYAIVRDTP